MHLDDRITTVVALKLKLPGIWGIRFGGAINATQVGVIASADAAPGIVVQGIVKELNKIAQIFDLVVVSQETLDLWDEMSQGFLFEGAVEVSGNEGLIEDLNGINVDVGAGAILGVKGDFDVGTGELKGAGLLLGGTFGVGADVAVTGAKTIVDLVKIMDFVGVEFHKDVDGTTPDGSLELKDGSTLHPDGTITTDVTHPTTSDSQNPGAAPETKSLPGDAAGRERRPGAQRKDDDSSPTIDPPLRAPENSAGSTRPAGKAKLGSLNINTPEIEANGLLAPSGPSSANRSRAGTRRLRLQTGPLKKDSSRHSDEARACRQPFLSSEVEDRLVDLTRRAHDARARGRVEESNRFFAERDRLSRRVFGSKAIVGAGLRRL